MQSWNYGLMIVLGMVLLAHCANPVAPTGGPRDTTPPKLLVSKSTKNEQTQFRPDKIKLYFDEYIEVQNPERNVIISPPLDPKPSYEVGSDHIEIDFSEADTLLPETTYSLNFDNAISDFNEGNPVEDLLFVFSTGDLLDSLQLEAEVVNAEGKPQEGITVMLYSETGNDSVVVNNLPTYFSKTNAEGIAKLRYLKGGEYKVFALQDDNLTLKYDIPGAAVAFLKQAVHIEPDSIQKVKLQLFVPASPTQMTRQPFLKKNAYVGVFNPLDTTVSCSLSPRSAELARRWNQDSLYIWIQPNVQTDSLVWTMDTRESIRRDTLLAPTVFDTIPIRGFAKTVKFVNGRATLSWNQPLRSVADSAFFVQDSLGQKFHFSVSSHSALKTHIRLDKDSIPMPSRTLMVLPGRLESEYNYTNMDTLQWTFSVVKEEDLSELILNLRFPDTTEHYVGQIMKSNTVVRERLFTGQNEYIWEIPFLEPSSYRLKIYHDSNKNRRQDGGDYWKGRQAEIWKEFPLETLRANWTIEEEIEWENETGSEESN